jgi:hypothetical protein
MKVGDWVFFKTRNWPKDVRAIKSEATGKTSDVTGEGLYSGRGRIVGIAGANYTVREERTDRLVEVGPHSDDRISPLACDYGTLTIGYLRAFLEQHKEASDDIPVVIPLPLSFFSDLEDMPPDHPEYKAVSECQSVEACGIGFVGVTEDGEVTDEYVPLEARQGKDWEFTLEIIPNEEQCFDALRQREDE